VTRHPAREVAHPFTDPTDWRDELDDLRRMLAEAGRSGPLRDEVAQLLVEAVRGDRIVLALRRASTRAGMQAMAMTLSVAADIAEATQ